MNQSLAGVVEEVLRRREFGEVYGAAHGLKGLLNSSLLDLRRQQGSQLWRRIASTPGAALGSGRRSLKPQETATVMNILREREIRYVFTIGGNDSAETAHRIAEEAPASDQEVVVIHVPKTIDNDLPATDHCPGYGSAARFVALATMGAGMDAEAMGEASPVTILEVMGRDAGWLAAASALGKREEKDAPHYICVPETLFDEDRFMARLEEALRRWGFAVAVTAQNVRGPSGPLGTQGGPVFVDDFGHEYFEGAGRYMSSLASRKLKVRARYERPGTIQRSLMSCVSVRDAQEAYQVGREAVAYALEGHSDSMVTLERSPGRKYRCETGLAPLAAVAGQVKLLPEEYVDASAGLMTRAFIDYARPLIGGRLPRYARLQGFQTESID